MIATDWNVGTVLKNLGVLPQHAARIVDELRFTFGDVPPGSLPQELQLVRGVLQPLWPALPPAGRLHMFVGAPGAGKTTVLCKWLTQAVLLAGRSARVFGRGELLGVHADILSVPVERSWTGDAWVEELGFVDGAEFPVPGAQVHLVLNAAYETAVLLAQVRAFAAWPVTDLIVTHLDEESRWLKLWNLVLGTNFPIRYLSRGQSIPGDFFPASAERIFVHDFPRK